MSKATNRFEALRNLLFILIGNPVQTSPRERRPRNPPEGPEGLQIKHTKRISRWGPYLPPGRPRGHRLRGKPDRLKRPQQHRRPDRKRWRRKSADACRRMLHLKCKDVVRRSPGSGKFRQRSVRAYGSFAPGSLGTRFLH